VNMRKITFPSRVVLAYRNKELGWRPIPNLGPHP
jgi:hypothetical protein